MRALVLVAPVLSPISLCPSLAPVRKSSRPPDDRQVHRFQTPSNRDRLSHSVFICKLKMKYDHRSTASSQEADGSPHCVTHSTSPRYGHRGMTAQCKTSIPRISSIKTSLVSPLAADSRTVDPVASFLRRGNISWTLDRTQLIVCALWPLIP
jgi:hypothetical protein